MEDGVPIAEKKPNHNGKSGCQISRFFRLIGALSIFNVYVFRFQKILAFWTTAFPMFPYLVYVLRESYEGLCFLQEKNTECCSISLSKF